MRTMNNKINEKVNIKEFTDNRKNNTLSNNVITYVNEIIKAGLAGHASDIHIKFDLLEGMEIKYRKLLRSLIPREVKIAFLLMRWQESEQYLRLYLHFLREKG